MTTPTRYRIRQTPTDVWSVRERLCLASSVLRSGDQNWVSVSRAIKSFGEPNRPPDWFSQKNCALQYSDLLEKVEAPKRKRWDRAEKETPGDLIVRKLTMERIEELKKLIQERQIKHRKLKREIEMVRCGHLDDKLDELLSQVEEEKKAQEDAEKEHQKWLEQRKEQIAAMKAMPRIGGALSKKKVPGKISRVGELKRRNSSQSEQSEQDSAVESPISEPHSIEVNDAVSPLPSAFEGLPCTPTKKTLPSSALTSQHPTPSTSPLLTSLLKSPTPAAPASPIGSILGSPSAQPKEGTLASQLTSPRSLSTPQPFFSPTSALASAAARQLAVATAPLAPCGSSLFSSNKQDSSSTASSSLPVPPVQSATSSAPTLSKLLEMPPSVPGKLPPLPIVNPPASSNTNTSPPANVEAKPSSNEKTSVSITETKTPPKETKQLFTPMTPIANIEAPVNEEIISVAVKIEPPDTIPAPPEVSNTVCAAGGAEAKEELVPTEVKLPEPISPAGASKPENVADTNEDFILHSTDIVIEGKGNDSSQEEEQVFVMEVDFAGEVKDEKGEIIEGVFEFDAPAGSILEVKYEPIVKKVPPKSEENHEEIKTEEKPLDESAATPGQILHIETVPAVKESQDVQLGVKDREEEMFTLDIKFQDGEESKIPDLGLVKEDEGHREVKGKEDEGHKEVKAKEDKGHMDIKAKEDKRHMDIKAKEDKENREVKAKEDKENREVKAKEDKGHREVKAEEEIKPDKEDKTQEESKVVPENQPEESEASENILSDFPTENDETSGNEQEESEQEAEVEQNLNEDDKESQVSDAEETKEVGAVSVPETECTTALEIEKSPPPEPVAKKEEVEEEKSMPVKKETDEKDEPEPVKQKVVETPAKSFKRSPIRKGRRGRGRGGGKTYTDMGVDHKTFQDDMCKNKDDEDEDDYEQKMEADRVESAAESETSEVVSLVDQSTESAVEPISDAAAEASVDSDENFTANEGEDISKDNLTGIESLEEESAAEQSQISAESEDKHKAPSSVTDSIPNSPASTAPSDDQESIREYKVWKKAIMLVWRAAANHKFANVFLHPVTNDVAPGYHGIVYRPMDLSVIKKNIENGVIRSTIEFQRDMMLMFQNAIMYNSSDHDVYHMALEMQKEVMEQIQDFLATQLMLQTAESKVLRVREREARERKSESTDKEDDLKRKRTSTSNSDTEVKVKKRKT